MFSMLDVGEWQIQSINALRPSDKSH